MSVFGAVALLLALVHDFWMPDDPVLFSDDLVTEG